MSLAIPNTDNPEPDRPDWLPEKEGKWITGNTHLNSRLEGFEDLGGWSLTLSHGLHHIIYLDKVGRPDLWAFRQWGEATGRPTHASPSGSLDDMRAIWCAYLLTRDPDTLRAQMAEL